MVRRVSVLQLLSIGLVLPSAVQGTGTPGSLSQGSPAARDVLLDEAAGLPVKREPLVDGSHEIRGALSSAEDLGNIEAFVERSTAGQEQKREPRKKRPSSGNNNNSNSTEQDDESGADRPAAITMHVSLAMGFALLVGFLQM